MLSVVLLFLLAMAGLGVFGRIRPGRKGARKAGRCPRCGRHRIGGTCACGKG